MTIVFKWSVEKVLATANNIVTDVYWRCEGFNEESNLSASCAGIRKLVRGDSFVPYEQLTEQQVIDWCFAPETITQTDKEGNVSTTAKLLKNESEAQIVDQLARQLAQKKSDLALPWKK